MGWLSNVKNLTRFQLYFIRLLPAECTKYSKQMSVKQVVMVQRF